MKRFGLFIFLFVGNLRKNEVVSQHVQLLCLSGEVFRVELSILLVYTVVFDWLSLGEELVLLVIELFQGFFLSVGVGQMSKG